MENRRSKRKYEKLSIIPIYYEPGNICTQSCADQVTVQSTGQELIRKDFSSESSFSVEWDTNFE